MLALTEPRYIIISCKLTRSIPLCVFGVVFCFVFVVVVCVFCVFLFCVFVCWLVS